MENVSVALEVPLSVDFNVTFVLFAVDLAIGGIVKKGRIFEFLCFDDLYITFFNNIV